MTKKKEDLLKINRSLRTYQLDALLKIFLYAKCLVKMFCGTGKSHIITNLIIHEKKKLNVIVFPSLALIMQYSMDYLLNEEKPYKKHFKKYTHINISSEKLDNVNSTTDPKEIKKFLNKKGPKIILVTYQSYHILLKCLEGQKIGLVCYDEAHHVTSPEYKKLVFFRPECFEKEVFFTATPRNENDITMYDRDAPEKNMCGDLAYDYTYLQGLKDGFLNAFQICIDMFTEDVNVSLYEAMARAILERGTSRVLSFHSGVNGESNTNVWNFVNPVDFQKAFDEVQQRDFPEKKGYYKNITFKGMDGKTPPDVRKQMLMELDNTPDNEIYIISSCETLGEGVDTKKANMCVFADPKSSITKIIQNIGRVVRPNPASPLSTILIPCFVDMEHYAAAQGDRVKMDELIREQMRANNGDYSPILNVLAALRQEDPELYDMCLNYPNKQHKEQSLNEQGYRIVEEDDDDYDGETYTPQEVEDMKEDGKTPLEIHTNETIERFNMDSSEPLKRLYYDEEVYKPIVKMDDAESETDEDKDDLQEIQPPKQKRIGMSIHHNENIEILWGVKEELDFNNKFCSAVIDCEVVKIDPMEVAIGIVERAEERVANGGRLLPKYIKKKEKSLIETQESSDSLKLKRWKNNSYISEEIIDYLNKNLVGWDYIRNNAEIAMHNARLIVQRARLRESMGKNVMPKFYRGNKYTSEQHIECKDAMRLGNWKSGLTCNNAVSVCIKKYLDEFLPEWNHDLDDVAMKCAIDIVKRSRIRQANGLNIIPKYRPKNQYPNLSDEYLQENYDKSKLGSWIDVLSGTGQGRCSTDIELYLNEHLRGWRETLDDKRTKEVKEVINRAKTRKANGGDLLPKQFHHIPKNERTPEQNVEYKDAIKIKHIKKAIEKPDKKHGRVVSKSVIDLLDENLPGWNESLNDIAIKFAHDIIKRANIRKESGRKLLPSWYKSPKNDEENQEKMDYNKLRNWNAALEGSKNNVCSDEVKNLLDLNLPGWSKPKPKPKPKLNPKPKPTKEKKQTPPIKKNRKLKLVIIDDESEEKGKLPIHHKTSAVGELHKIYRRMRSDTLHEKFKSDPQLWRDYHAIRNQNLASFDPASIPSNIIIRNLENDYMNLKRTKKVVDMGCGEAPIAHYFQNKTDKHQRFDFYNYDHLSGGDPIISETDISSLPLEDESIEIAIMSLALWGTSENCTQYIKEAYRVLEKGGGSRFYIIDCTNKWSPEPTTPENAGQLLRTLLTTNGFDIIENKTDIGDKFCLFVCSKN